MSIKLKKEIFQRSFDCLEVFAHKVAYVYVWFNNPAFRNNISIKRVINHDLRKAVDILIMGDVLATIKHRKEEGHHNFHCIADLWEAICDWECASITKPAKPLNGRATWEAYYSHLPLKPFMDMANI